MSGRLKRQRQDWDDLASLDPYWAVLTHPERKHGGWDLESFFATGSREVEEMLAAAAELSLPARREAALDFGCGLGRLTRALARHFEQVTGLDISDALVVRARELSGDVPNCEFRVSRGRDLAAIPSASLDLVLSSIVLQHQPSQRLIRDYLTEFVRVVRPGGLVVFQLPTAIPIQHRIQPRRRLYRLLRGVGLPPETLYRRLRLDPMRMTFMAPRQVAAAVERAGARVVKTREDVYGGAFPSMTYFVTTGEGDPR